MYGLVLEGGGAKGAYQIGAYFALVELGFEFEAVVGTSIGSINGAMIAMGEAEKCVELWRTLNLKDLIKEAEVRTVVSKTNKSEDRSDEEKEISEVIKAILSDGDEILDSIKSAFMDLLNTKTVSLQPLKDLVSNNIAEEKVRNSKMKFGLVTVNVTDKKAEELYIEDIPKGELNKYIVASCYLPVFKLEPLDGKYYLDGGFYNKVPYNMVEKLNLTPIIVRTGPADIRDLSFPKNAIVIEPKKNHTSVMDFDPIKADELIRIGYFDTYKKIKSLRGNKYYIEDFSEEEAFKIIKDIFFDKLDFFAEDSNFNLSSKYRRLFEEVIPKLSSRLGLRGNYTYADFVAALVEEEAERQNIEYLRIYKISELIDELMKKNGIEFANYELSKFNQLVKKIIK